MFSKCEFRQTLVIILEFEPWDRKKALELALAICVALVKANNKPL